MAPARVAVVGDGWRARFFVRLAALLPDDLVLAGQVVRRPESAREAAARHGAPVHPSLTDLLAAGRPDLVVTSLPWDANPAGVLEAVRAGCHVLSETPPAPDAAGLAALWEEAGGDERVAVAEQYHLMPGHAARRAAVRRGVVGVPGQVQVSSTHGYHAVSLVRTLLATGPVEHRGATVRATRLHGPLVDPLSRTGWTDDDTVHRASTVLATLDLGDAAGVYDFTDNQWHNPLRTRRLLVRGSLGEIDGDVVTRLAGPRTVVRSTIERRQLGYDLDLDGYDTDHLSLDGDPLWRNEFAGLRLADEEIAIATVLRDAARWSVGTGPNPYPLSQAATDHLLSLAIDEALATQDAVVVAPGPWAARAEPWEPAG